jgi:hypothetical protein
LANVAKLVPAEEALEIALRIEDWSWRDQALAEVAERLRAAKALAIARSIDDRKERAQALAKLAERLCQDQIDDCVYQWLESIHDMSKRNRVDCISDLRSILLWMQTFAGTASILGLARSISCVGRWWP